MRLFDHLDWSVLLIASALLGLAPFTPEPHVWEKLKMLANGTLTKPIDIFDFLMHGTPFLLLALKGLREVTKPKSDEGEPR
ncbi:RND transporter [Rhodalgimonas zhirmunskyi]|uniref:RND transporter n=1 Tax=Rhodalgimonas zhirmunskyi TaxID=2964767 RepID=A0AAJ1U492_9RHOB|nr:RND transporter [Rhodoalgimonas zhirmunskyi]MDQ2092915.1 RND transporter [Rhodoalgimonas zhirmunskyi]